MLKRIPTKIEQNYKTQFNKLKLLKVQQNLLVVNCFMWLFFTINLCVITIYSYSRSKKKIKVEIKDNSL